ncbi:pentatricopeptide repeat-containing protein At1g79080, chloroplastic-like [Spinacia oleracea]|uniref:Pentatricopeptide repeat-containing protein At1g79080, chloroplastic-like n=1 Tax=Spinacia oleracea TaxID=3562 RepID=A0A9R0IB68_SPIOL|nr:pentatricopeptide repeat-containing protein At1g79080, chloroplastic-like [Spinacia oleracea]
MAENPENKREIICDEKLKGILAEMDDGERNPYVVTYNILVSSLALHGQVDQGFLVLEEMMRHYSNFQEPPTTRLLYISARGRKNNTYPALKPLKQMTKYGFTPDSHTYSTLLKGLCIEGILGAAVEIFMLVEGNNYRLDVDNCNALKLGLCKSYRTDLSLGIVDEEEMELATKVLKELYERKVLSRNTMERLGMQYDLEGLLV